MGRNERLARTVLATPFPTQQPWVEAETDSTAAAAWLAAGRHPQLLIEMKWVCDRCKKLLDGPFTQGWKWHTPAESSGTVAVRQSLMPPCW